MLGLPQVGDRVAATLNRPIIVNGKEVASAETLVRAKLTYARRNGRFHHAGYLTLRLTSMGLLAADMVWKANAVRDNGDSHTRGNVETTSGVAGLWQSSVPWPAIVKERFVVC
jgi:hypothetical protein